MNENINIDRLFLSRESKTFVPQPPSVSNAGFYDIDFDAYPDNAISLCDAGIIIKISIDDFSSASSKPTNRPADLYGATLKMCHIFPFINSVPQLCSSFGSSLIVIKNRIAPISYNFWEHTYLFNFPGKPFEFLTRIQKDWLMNLVDLPGGEGDNAIMVTCPLTRGSIIYAGASPLDPSRIGVTLVASQTFNPVQVDPGVYYLCGTLSSLPERPQGQVGGVLAGASPVFFSYLYGSLDTDGSAGPYFDIPNASYIWGNAPDIASIPEIAKQTFPASWR